MENTLNYSNDIAKKINLSFSRDSIDISFDSVESTSSKPYLLNITTYTAYNNKFRIGDIKDVA